jgi:hypothetical protein
MIKPGGWWEVLLLQEKVHILFLQQIQAEYLDQLKVSHRVAG